MRVLLIALLAAISYAQTDFSYFSSFVPYISQKTDVPIEFKVIEPGTQIMSDIGLPTRMVNFGTEGVDQVHALRRNSSSLSLEGVGSVSLFYLENSKYGLLCTKEEITKENNIGELLIFDVRNLRVSTEAYESLRINGVILGLLRIVSRFDSPGEYDMDGLHDQIVKDMKFVKAAAKPGKILCTDTSVIQASCRPKIIPIEVYTIKLRVSIYIGIIAFFAILPFFMHDFRAELHILVAPCITFYAERVFAVGYMDVVDNHQTFTDEVLLLCFGHIMNAMLIVIALHGKEDQFTSQTVYQIFRGGVLLFLLMDLCLELLVLDHHRRAHVFIS